MNIAMAGRSDTNHRCLAAYWGSTPGRKGAVRPFGRRGRQAAAADAGAGRVDRMLRDRPGRRRLRESGQRIALAFAQLVICLNRVAKFLHSGGGWIELDIGCAPDGGKENSDYKDNADYSSADWLAARRLTAETCAAARPAFRYSLGEPLRLRESPRTGARYPTRCTRETDRD
jgi:hypothetical protein